MMIRPNPKLLRFLKIIIPIIALIVLSVIVWNYRTTKPEQYSVVTRGPVTKEDVIEKNFQDANNTMDKFLSIISGLGIILTALGGYAALNISQFKIETRNSFLESRTEWKADISKLQTTINEFLDQKDREDIYTRLHQIEKEALQYVEGFEINSFIEVVTSRTIMFMQNVLTHKLTDDLLDLALRRIDIRLEECRCQANQLKFNEKLLKGLEEIRIRNTDILRNGLIDLNKEDIFNDQYRRIGELGMHFLRSMLREIIKFYIKNENS